MTDLMLIFNEVVGLHLHQWKWKHLSQLIWEALDPTKTEITAVVTDLDTVVTRAHIRRSSLNSYDALNVA